MKKLIRAIACVCGDTVTVEVEEGSSVKLGEQLFAEVRKHVV
jgi:hypothetical protein